MPLVATAPTLPKYLSSIKLSGCLYFTDMTLVQCHGTSLDSRDQTRIV